MSDRVLGAPMLVLCPMQMAIGQGASGLRPDAFQVLRSARLAVCLQTALYGCVVIWFGLASASGTVRFELASLPGPHHPLMGGRQDPHDHRRTRGYAPGDARALPARPCPPYPIPPCPPQCWKSASCFRCTSCSQPSPSWWAIGPGRRVNGRAAASYAAMRADMAALLAML